MADNISVTAGSGTTIAADDISGALHQRIKLTWGVDGSAVDASASNPLPTSAAQSGTWNITNISGTVSLPTGAATAANQSTLNTNIGSSSDAVVANGVAGSIASYLRTIKDAATDTTTASPVKIVDDDEYETVAASQTDQAMGATGATGDILSHLLIIPATTSPGAVSIKDGSGSAITVFTGGASSVTNLVPFVVPIGAKSTSGAWKITTGASVSAIAFGDFS